MNEEITASAPLDVESHLLAFKWTHKWVRTRGIVLILIAVLCVPMAIYFGVENGKIDNQTITPFALLALIGLFQGFRFLRLKSAFIQQTKVIPGYGEKLVWSFRNAGYEVRVGESISSVAWNHVSETKSTPDGVLIYPQPGLWEWLPKTAFTSEADYNRFLDLLAAKTKHSVIN